MDEPNKNMPTAPQTETLARPAIETSDLTATSILQYTPYGAFNDFMLRLQQLKAYHKDWDNPRNQNRPFKASFIEFLKNLILRLPVAPEITPLVDGSVRMRFKKRAPRDKWQVMDCIIYPQRYFELEAKSRMPHQAPFKRTNIARPDYISDMVKAFYELDYVNTKEHPLRFRKAGFNDYPFISAMCQMTFGPHPDYHPAKIAKLCQYCYVSEDPIYGIVSVAAISEDENIPRQFKVNFMITAQNYRGLSMASKCLRKCVQAVSTDFPNTVITAESPMAYDSIQDVAHSALKRASFKKVKIVKGEKRYQCFDCDRCNTGNGYCRFGTSTDVCSTVHYEMKTKNMTAKK